MKENLATEQLRHEDAHELSEDMAQRKEIEKTNGVNHALPFQIALNLPLEWSQVRHQIAVSDDDPFRLSRRAGCEDDLYGIVVTVVCYGIGF